MTISGDCSPGRTVSTPKCGWEERGTLKSLPGSLWNNPIWSPRRHTRSPHLTTAALWTWTGRSYGLRPAWTFLPGLAGGSAPRQRPLDGVPSWIWRTTIDFSHITCLVNTLSRAVWETEEIQKGCLVNSIFTKCLPGAVLLQQRSWVRQGTSPSALHAPALLLLFYQPHWHAVQGRLWISPMRVQKID